jgi:hypothetical protein
MSRYPISSLPDNRLCRGRVCPIYPCKHSDSQDPDAVEEIEEALQFPGSNRKLWAAWRSSKEHPRLCSNDEIPAEEWAWYEARFPRCDRMTEKRRNGVYAAEKVEWKKALEEFERISEVAGPGKGGSYTSHL